MSVSDRTGHEVFRCKNKGKPKSKTILEILENHIDKKSMLITDGAFCYDQLAKKYECELVQCKTTSSYTKVKHLNTINCCHHQIRTMLNQFKGVASKYMNRYLALFTFIREFIGMDNAEKVQLFQEKLQTYQFNITIKSLKNEYLAFD